MHKRISNLLKLVNNSWLSTRATSSQNQTIYALASGSAQKCGVAVIRLSGRSSLNVLSSLTNEDPANFKPRFMYHKNIWHPITKEKLDKALVVWFKGGFTQSILKKTLLY